MTGDRDMLADALEAAAILEGLELLKQGGPTEEQVDAARAKLAAAPYADVLMFGGDSGQLRAAFAANAEALAVLSHAPGGVKFAGGRIDRIDRTGLWAKHGEEAGE